MGGGHALGHRLYCVNAARYLFRAEPEEVFAFDASSKEPSVSARLRKA